MKRIIPTLLMLGLVASFLVYYYYPLGLKDIMGPLPQVTQDTRMEIRKSNSILEPAEVVTIKKGARAADLLTFLNQYQYKRTSINFTALGNEVLYSITLYEGEKEIFRMAIRGDQYVSLFSKRDRWTLYKVAGDPLDLDVIKSF